MAGLGTPINASNLSSGNWIPLLSIGGSQTGITYTTQKGGYQIVGNICFMWCQFALSSKGGLTGACTLNLPFVSNITRQGTNDHTPIPAITGITIPANAGQLFVKTVGTTSAQLLWSPTNAGAAFALDGAQLSNTSGLTFNGFYNIS